ncbi:tRNA (cytosine(34)-C(5))-methyltransferase [Dendrobium catenatum]|nr:tRNA (cytosine(34)-C(5))-methyltransferase [Dendrobium catenatum]
MGGGKGGQKRGRTQRRHFRQGRENVWKYDNKRTRSDEDATVEDPSANPNPNPSWEPFSTKNLGFEEYYKGQVIVPEEEWEEFISLLRKPLPAAFRINASGQFFKDIRLQLENEFMKSLDTETSNDYEIEAIRPLPWYPDKLAWHLNFSRMQLRKNQILERFHEFLKQENEVGTITRQEAVSMVPPLFLDVLPDHYILDMCAAPGSKTFQLLEIIHQSIKPGSLPHGLVIANDVDVQRCNLLIHQTKRMCSANLIVTNHEAQFFPSCLLQGELKKDILQFDRVLCDVPCSGDGTLRKAPDIWRKWNAGMGNGLHRLQVEIAMRGVTLLKVGGRMVYSTCSMNPVENEAVVAEILRRNKGSVELLDVSHELPGLVRRPGLKTWKVRDKGLWLAAYEDVPISRRGVIFPSMFPSDQSCLKKFQCDSQDVMDSSAVENKCSFELKDHLVNIIDPDNELKKIKNNATLVDVSKDAIKREDDKGVGASQDDLNEMKARVSSFDLERCMRILPHDQNSGAFFIAVLRKISSLHDDSVKRIGQSTRKRNTQKGTTSLGLERDDQLVAEAASGLNSTDELSSVVSEETGFRSQGPDPYSKDDEAEKVVAFDKIGDDSSETRQTKGVLQMQGKWRGVDPVVLFRDENTINSIRSFYGISDLFLLDGHLVTRNIDANHVKRIYYVSKSVHDILELNFKVGEKLKITSLGLKVFERQSCKDASTTCMFRLSSEGLPLLLPYIGKQILCASLADFRHLLQYRTIKFPDFVDDDFREKASILMSGCCVIVLKQGNEKTYQYSADSSAIAIVCWKGKTNLSIMVSQLDSQQLLDRLAVRFGGQKGSPPDQNNFVLDESNNSRLDITEKELSEAGHVEGFEED